MSEKQKYKSHILKRTVEAGKVKHFCLINYLKDDLINKIVDSFSVDKQTDLIE